MSTNKTEHLQLNKWESTDEFHREEFNENFAKIDAGVKGAEIAASAALSAYQTTNDKALADGLAAQTAALAARTPRVAVGTYTGNNSLSTSTAVSVGFEPQMVFVWADKSDTTSGYKANYSGMAVRGHSLQGMLTLTATGFTVINKETREGYTIFPQLNSTMMYLYFAIG